MQRITTTSGQYSEDTTLSSADGGLKKSGSRTPCVQYDSDSSKRNPTLTPITEPIPDDATVVSPIYFLNDFQIERQARLEDPYAIKGEYKSIASELQDECEFGGRVSYPIYVESDDIGEEKSRYEVYEALHESVREIFGVSPDDCRWFFSGNRSIHAHLPLVAHDDEQLKEIRSIVNEYNEDADVELDSQIYSRKRMFRLPDVTHHKTGYSKIEVDANVSETELNQQLVNSYLLEPEFENDERITFLDVLEENGLEWEVEEDSIVPHQHEHHTLNLLQGLAIEALYPENSDMGGEGGYINDTPILTLGESEEKSDDPYCESVRQSHRRNHYSPYRSREGTRRSVTVFEVMGSPFCEMREGTRRTLVPAHVTAINGESDSHYRVDGEYRPVFLSCGDDGTGGDYEKFANMDIDVGDSVIMISGRSNKSRIIQDDEYGWLIPILISNFQGGEDGREAAIETMEREGIVTGESSHIESNYDRVWDWATSKDFAEHPSNDDKTEAQQLQEAIESGEKHFVHDLSHGERWRLVWRLLRIGNRETAYNWIKEQCESDFKPDVTERELNRAVEEFEAIDEPEAHTDSAVTESFVD